MVIDKGSFSEVEAKPVIKQTVLALQYLHRNDIVHRVSFWEMTLYRQHTRAVLRLILLISNDFYS